MRLLKTFRFWNSKDIVSYFRDKPADPRVKTRLQKLVDHTGDAQNMTALDLGCGAGRHSELLLQMGFKTAVIDSNWEMLRSTVSRVGKSNLLSATQGTIVRLPYKNDSFDVVVATGVLHQAKNMSEYQQAVRELSRVLKLGGVVCLNIFTSLVLDNTHTKLKAAFAYETKEGLPMTLLSKTTFYELMGWYGLTLEEEISEDVVIENTGKRSVLRCNFVKIK